MVGIATAIHAYNLFSLTVESRYGARWRASVEAATVRALADDIAAGFGGQADGEGHAHGEIVAWRFPDGSRAHTGRFGLRCEGVEECVA